MRTIEEIIADSHKATEAAIREAFEAGKAHATSDLKSKVTAFFDSLAAPAETYAEPHPAPSEPEHQFENTSHHDGEQQSDSNNY